MTWRPSRSLLSAALPLVLCGVWVATPTSASADANADFVGHWAPAGGGGGWTVTSQATDGTCAGTSDFTGYGFSNCHVSGTAYTFDVTTGSGYVSHNTGHLTGDDISDGNFNDGSGDHPYTAHRTSGGSTGPYATALMLVCNTPAAPSQQGSCTATVGGSGTATHPYPTGGVSMTASSGTLYGTTCTLAAATGSGSAPSCTLPYRPPAGGLPAGTPVPVSASYAGDGTFSASSASTRLYGYAADPDSDDPLGVCVSDGSGDDQGACSGYDAAIDALIDALDQDLAITDACPGTAPGAARPAAGQDPAALTQCHLQFQEALASQDAASLSTRTRQNQLLDNLIELYGGNTNQHSGNIPRDATLESEAVILRALKNLKNGTGSASPAVETLIDGAARTLHSTSHDHQLLDQLPGGSDPTARQAPRASAGRHLDISAALDFVLARHATHRDRAAFLQAVAQAYAPRHSVTRVRARETLITARLLATYRLQQHAGQHARKHARGLTLATGEATLAAGTTATFRLQLPRAAQQALLVLALSPGRPAHPQLQLTQTRDGHTRRATTTLRLADLPTLG